MPDSIKIVWENNPDAPITASNLSKSLDMVASYRDFDITPLPRRSGTFLIAESPAYESLILKRDSLFSIINTGEKLGEKILGINDHYRMFDVGLEDLRLTVDNMDDNLSNPVGTWGVNKEWFVYICDKYDSSLEEKELPDDYGGGAQVLISMGINYPIGQPPGEPTINYSEKDVRKIGGFKSNAIGKIVPDSVWDISYKFSSLAAKKYYVLDEYTADDEDVVIPKRHLFRPLRLSDLDTTTINSNIIRNDFYVKNSVDMDRFIIDVNNDETNILTETFTVDNAISNIINSISMTINTPAMTVTSANTVYKGNFIVKTVADVERLKVDVSSNTITANGIFSVKTLGGTTERFNIDPTTNSLTITNTTTSITSTSSTTITSPTTVKGIFSIKTVGDVEKFKIDVVADSFVLSMNTATITVPTIIINASTSMTITSPTIIINASTSMTITSPTTIKGIFSVKTVGNIEKLNLNPTNNTLVITSTTTNNGDLSIKNTAGTFEQVSINTTDKISKFTGDVNISYINNTVNKNWISVASSTDGLKLIAAEKGGYLYTSVDSGVTWTPCMWVWSGSDLVSFTTKAWLRVASSSDGSKLAAVVTDVGLETTGYVYTSFDYGATWYERTGSGSRNWRGLVINDSGSTLLATTSVGAGGRIYKSTDYGGSWAAVGPTVYWNEIAADNICDDMYALAEGDDTASSAIYRTQDGGTNWSVVLPTDRYYHCVATDDDGSTVLVGVGGYIGSAGHIGYLYLSINTGGDWTPITSLGSRNWTSVAINSDGTKMAAVADGALYINSGTGWGGVNPGGVGTQSWSSVAYFGNRIIATAYNGSIYISDDDGSTWTTGTLRGDSTNNGGSLFAEHMVLPIKPPKEPKIGSMFLSDAMSSVSAYLYIYTGTEWKRVAIAAP